MYSYEERAAKWLESVAPYLEDLTITDASYKKIRPDEVQILLRASPVFALLVLKKTIRSFMKVTARKGRELNIYIKGTPAVSNKGVAITLKILPEEHTPVIDTMSDEEIKQLRKGSKTVPLPTKGAV